MRKTGNTGTKRRVTVLLLSGAVLVLVFLFSFSIGRYGVPALEVVRILFHRFLTLTGLDRVLPMAVTWTAEMETVVINIRLPRIVMACLVGCSLSAAGAAFQGVFQNPMASPGFRTEKYDSVRKQYRI